ncbi:MAG: sulfatase [Bacteroidota bacterium]
MENAQRNIKTGKRSYGKLFSLCVSWVFLAGCTNGTVHQPLNILWITSEDMNAFLGAFGDSVAYTPYLDRLASEGVRYTHAFATAPVCSPSRSCLVTGVYATSMGTQHLRSELTIPEAIIPFPKFLREKGYYCTNNKKEDYNFQDPTIWDESSATAHWRNRKEGQPFFAVFNFETTHQSRIFGSDSVFHERFGKRLPEELRHDPQQMVPPPYHFDSPLIRKMWARYYDLVTIMDQQVGEILQQLEEDGLTENTLIMYYSDHGTGMPRSKRALYDSGLRVPLIIKAPKHLQEDLGLRPGTSTAELVSFVDFAPTMLNILDLPIPAYMQGIPFLGSHKQTQAYIFGHSDRVDEALELSRTVRGPRYRYVRNYYPQLPLIQPNFYTDQSEIMQELYRVKALGKLSPAQASMWQEERPTEELYDTESDPFETHNLAKDPSLRETLLSMREAQKNWARKTFDSGLLPEPLMQAYGKDSTIYQVLRDTLLFPQEKILTLADRMLQTKPYRKLIDEALLSQNPALRYWGVLTLEADEKIPKEQEQMIIALLEDPVPTVSIAAAAKLCRSGMCEAAYPTLLRHMATQAGMNRVIAARIFQLYIDQAGSNTQQAAWNLMSGPCPESNRLNYYTRYFCWALEEGFKSIGKEVETISFP